ncbi:uncharacterized protein EV422DRAFT_572470 [Fimicolochytrium jonesii]|uniref:uncharacterized protein n=1 Tax=Fimicolochytrium jonesii TaxID=1396493 RepID=UPI0022FE1D51|nr:uncharacterized protein EV422DRAFT_572470 [Fimicolochytrium jonesii]KAI8815771.1 hypothetical protein EV422DRAFT_572470 [Fimicolochytrium jonesii]
MKKTPKNSASAGEDDLDALVRQIENADIPPAPPNQCAAAGCKAKTHIAGVDCGFCKRRFCLAHRLPETHAQICTTRTSRTAHAKHASNATLFSAMVARDPVKASRPGALEREREDARRRVRGGGKEGKSGGGDGGGGGGKAK